MKPAARKPAPTFTGGLRPLPPSLNLVTGATFLPVGNAATVAGNGWKGMENTATIIICFECRKRTSQEEIKAGYHSHADMFDLELPFDPAAVGED